MILLLHTLIEAAIGLLFLFHPQAGEIIPGFGSATGDSFDLLMKMYGLAALFLAAISLYAYFKRSEDNLFLAATLGLSLFHYGMMIVQFLYNSDQRASLLHFLLAIFLTTQYLKRRKMRWNHA